MAIKSSGRLSFSEINAELGRSGKFGMCTDAGGLRLIGKPAGSRVLLSDYYGKANYVAESFLYTTPGIHRVSLPADARTILVSIWGGGGGGGGSDRRDPGRPGGSGLFLQFVIDMVAAGLSGGGLIEAYVAGGGEGGPNQGGRRGGNGGYGYYTGGTGGREGTSGGSGNGGGGGGSSAIIMLGNLIAFAGGGGAGGGSGDYSRSFNLTPYSDGNWHRQGITNSILGFGNGGVGANHPWSDGPGAGGGGGPNGLPGVFLNAEPEVNLWGPESWAPGGGQGFGYLRTAGIVRHDWYDANQTGTGYGVGGGTATTGGNGAVRIDTLRNTYIYAEQEYSYVVRPILQYPYYYAPSDPSTTGSDGGGGA